MFITLNLMNITKVLFVRVVLSQNLDCSKFLTFQMLKLVQP